MSDFEGTGPLPRELRFDKAALRERLVDAIPDLEGGFHVTKFRGGQSNPTLLIETDGARYVLRRKPTGRVLDSAHRVDREARVMRALGGSDVPVPQVLYDTDDSALMGSPFYVMSFLDGRVFWDPTLPDLSREERGAVYDALIDVLAKLHSVDPDAVGLSDFGPRDGYFRRQAERWGAQYERAAASPLPAMTSLARWLPGHLPDSERLAVIHGDYRLDNLVFAKDEPRPIGLIDWELSTLGHPLGDLSYLLLGWKVPMTADGGPSLASVDPSDLGIPTYDAVVARYEQSSGIEAEGLDVLLVYNLFRLASILEGVAARGRQGNASSPQAVRFGAMVAPLAAMACEVAGIDG